VRETQLYRQNTIYRIIDADTVTRYKILETIPESRFYVLHADFLRLSENNAEYFDSLTLERLFEISPEKISWEMSIEEAIRIHDKLFEN